MSPGIAAGIFHFFFIQAGKQCVGRLVKELRLVPLIEFAQTAADGRTLVTRQLG